VAFIRRKKVHGYQYYQVVKNYRDGSNHRQKVLCHLGKHDSIKAAIAAEQKQVRIYRERARLRRLRARAVKADLLSKHGWEFVEGKIPSEEVAARQLTHWQEVRAIYLDPSQLKQYTYSGIEYIEFEDADIEVGKYTACISYYAAERLAYEADSRAEAHQERLDKLLQVQREYF
jgi:hypothetical protein